MAGRFSDPSQEQSAVPRALSDLLFSGVAERPMWGRFLVALAERLDAELAGLVIAPLDPRQQEPALLLARQADAVRLQAALGPHDLPSLPFDRPVALAGGGWVVRVALEGGRSIWLAVVRQQSAAPPADALAVLEGLLPLLVRILPFYAVIGDSERRWLVAEHVLETSGIGVALVDSAGRVVLINPVAEAIVAGGDVLAIRDGRLVAREAADQRRLAHLIDEMAGEQQSRPVPGRHAALALLRDSDAMPVTVMVRPGPPFGPVSAPLRRTATLILRDPARRIGLVAADLIQLFQLTPAEARLACLLGDGGSLDECALQLGVTRNTARTQLRAIFAKTGTNRQGDLVRLLLTSIASHAQPPPGAG